MGSSLMLVCTALNQRLNFKDRYVIALSCSYSVASLKDMYMSAAKRQETLQLERQYCDVVSSGCFELRESNSLTSVAQQYFFGQTARTSTLLTLLQFLMLCQVCDLFGASAQSSRRVSER